MRDLENKNIEFEQEIQSLQEDNNMISIKNKELLLIINLLNIRLREINRQLFDFSRDKPHEEILNANACLINEIDKVKEERMMVEVELAKLKGAIEKRKSRLSRPSKPEKGKGFDCPNSPEFFNFDGEENDVFGDSFIIDSNNKELEDKCRQVEEELNAARETIIHKNRNIVELEE